MRSINEYWLMSFKGDRLVNLSSHLTMECAKTFIEKDQYIYKGSVQAVVDLLKAYNSNSTSTEVSLDDIEVANQSVNMYQEYNK